jgi:putative flippase GtrA
MLNEYLNPRLWFIFLRETRYLHFFGVGATGVAINLAITAFFAEIVFGRTHYFNAYLIGLFVNLLYNFVFHTFVTFKTNSKHLYRLSIFVIYSLTLAYIQAYIVKYLTDWLGINWYIVIIASVIFIFSITTFVLFKFVLFKEAASEDTGQISGS